MWNWRKYLGHYIQAVVILENTSVYTILCVQSSNEVGLFSINTLRPFGEVILDSATYNWPWEKTGEGKYTPTVYNVWPWLLLMVMAYESHMGNWRRFNLKGHFDWVDVVIMRGIYAFEPLAFPVIISPSITLVVSWVTISLVPLQSPLEGSRFRRSIIGTPIFRCRMWSGSPLIEIVLRNSVGYSDSRVE